MGEHALDDAVGALPVLLDAAGVLGQVVEQVRTRRHRGCGGAVGLGEQFVFEVGDEFGGEGGEVVDEVERVLDLVRDAGGERAERSPASPAARVAAARL